MSLLKTTSVQYFRDADKTILMEESSNKEAFPLVGLVDTEGLPLDFPRTAFMELEVSQPHPKVQLQFPYNLNLDIVEIRDNKGSSTVVDNKANLSTGAAANQSANILTRVPLGYKPGQGVKVSFTALFPIGKTGSFQWVGLGDQGDAFFIGNDGANSGNFSILHRRGGVPEVRRLKIDTASSDTDDITITLDGDTISIEVTNTGDVTLTANEIGSKDYSGVGRGWEVHTMGDNVFFTSYNSGAKAGTYSLSDATSAVGTFTRSLVGVTATENIIAQTDWSEDKFNPDVDGTPDADSPAGIILDRTKGNVFRIKFGWHGFSGITFEILNKDTFKWVLVHKLKYSNTNTLPSVNNPTLPLCAISENTTNATDMVLEYCSAGGFVEGLNDVPGIPHSISKALASIGTTEKPIFTIHAHDIYQGGLNRVAIENILFTAAIDGNKPATVRVRKNAVLTGASFSALDSNTSTILIDTSATAVSGGEEVYTRGLAKDGDIDIDLHERGIILVAPDFLTLTIQASATTTDAVGSGNWQEKF